MAYELLVSSRYPKVTRACEAAIEFHRFEMMEVGSDDDSMNRRVSAYCGLLCVQMNPSRAIDDLSKPIQALVRRLIEYKMQFEATRDGGHYNEVGTCNAHHLVFLEDDLSYACSRSCQTSGSESLVSRY